MSQVYLETSVISALVSNRSDPASVYQRQATSAWWNSQRGRHELFISEEVVAELSSPEYPLRDTALRIATAIPQLPITRDVIGLAMVLVREKVMPAPASGDAVHVAASTVHGMDFLLSWNVRHLANANKVEHLTVICSRLGYLPPRIITPDMLWEDQDE